MKETCTSAHSSGFKWKHCITAIFAFLAQAFINIQCVRGAFFYVHEAKERCFMENVPQGIAITASYNNPVNPGVTCTITFKDPNDRQVYTKEVPPNDGKGKVTHMAQQHGEYNVCIYCPSSRWFAQKMLRWTLSIELGDTDVNLDELAKKEHVSTVEMRMMSLMTRINAIVAEDNYEREQEVQFEKTTQVINSRVLWLAVIEILLMCCTTLFTVFHLTRFFQSQKLL